MNLRRRGRSWRPTRRGPRSAAVFGAAALLAAAAHAQPGAESPGPAVDLAELAPLSAVPVLETPPVSAAAGPSPDRPGEPYRFAEPFAVDATPATAGLWEAADDGRTAVWRLRVVSEGAVSLNLGFTEYRMPPGGGLRLYAPGGADVVGPFGAEDNKPHGELWTPLIPGGELVIEATAPADRVGELELRLGSVNRGFRDFPVSRRAASVARDARNGGAFPARDISPSHSSCNIDVECSEGDPYRDQIRSVARMTLGGVSGCSGALVNNTAEDYKPYFLSALHCFEDGWDRTAVFYWNDERTDCGTGETSTDSEEGKPTQTQTGATERFRHSRSDTILLELDEKPDDEANVYYAGWSRRGSAPTSWALIHHPRGHHKSITLGDRAWRSGRHVTSFQYAGDFWGVDPVKGAIEGGSSGAPLFDQNKRVVGTQHGGSIHCDPDASDSWSGRLTSAWSSGRLSRWLDPGNTGVKVLDGLNGGRSPRVVGELDDVALRLTDTGYSVDAATAVRHPDLNDLVWAASSSDEDVATVSLDGTTATVTPVAAGSSTITVTATQAAPEAVATLTFDVTVGDNRSPDAVGTIASLSLAGAPASSSVDVAAAFSDVDGDALTYDAASSDTSVATLSVSASTVTVTAVASGASTITVGARDAGGSGTRARQSFKVTVANAPPSAVGTLPALTVRVIDRTRFISLPLDAFSDADDDDLRLSWSWSNRDIATVRFYSSQFHLTPLRVGSGTMRVSATDPSGASASHEFQVTVANSPPRLGGYSRLTLRLTDGAVTWRVWSEDPDGDALTHSASSSNPAVATATMAPGKWITLTPVSVGATTVNLRATDAHGASSTGSFPVRVRSGPPVAVGTLPDLTLRLGDGAESLDVSGAFSHPDGDPLEFLVSSSNSAVARATGTGSVVRVTPVRVGSATVTVEARDESGATAAQEFEARVRGRRGVTISTDALTVDEGSTATYTVVLDSEPAGTVTVTPSAPAGGNLSVAPAEVSFTAGDWESAKTVTVEAAADANTVSEPPVTIGHQVRGADYGSVTAAAVQVTIVEKDTSVLSVEGVSAPEGVGALTFEVRLSKAAVSDIAVDYATSDGSGASGARAGSDYTASSGTLTFPANSTVPRRIVVAVTDDEVDEEEEETFRLTLRNPRHASLAGGGSTLEVFGTIEDDDDPAVAASFGSADYAVAEGRTVTVSVRLDRDPERDLEIFLERRHLGGAEARDYSGVPRSVVFGPGVRSREFPVSATDDAFDDDGESVELSFVSLPPRVTGGGAATIAIEDNDAAPGGSPRTGAGGGPGGGSDDDEDRGDRDGDGGSGGGDSGGGSGGPPRASFTQDARCGADGLCRAKTERPVTFTDTSTGSVASRAWDFGDGGTARGPRPDHAWSEPGFYRVTLKVRGGAMGATESTRTRTFLVEPIDPAGTCEVDAETSCLRDARYSLEAEWWNPEGDGGAAELVHAGTNDSGLFRFFDPDNWELLIKVLDGCAANGHVWVFGASTTDLGYAIRVTDTVTGELREYRNEPGRPAQAITDARAFRESCGPRR